MAAQWRTYLALFDADVFLGLESHVSELEVLGVESKVGQLLDFLESEWKVSGLHCLVYKENLSKRRFK